MKHIIFDFDGTLVKSFELIDFCLEKTSKELGYNYSTDDNRKFFGRNEEGLLEKVYGKEDIRSEFALYLKNYNDYHDSLLPTFYPGIIELLQKYFNKGIKMHLITGRSLESLMISLTKLDAFKFFTSWYTGSKEKIIKTENLNDFLNKNDLNPNDIIYVGDSHSDWKCCNEAGVKCISALYIYDYAAKKLQIDNSSLIANSVKELEYLLDKFLKEEKHA